MIEKIEKIIDIAYYFICLTMAWCSINIALVFVLRTAEDLTSVTVIGWVIAGGVWFTAAALWEKS